MTVFFVLSGFLATRSYLRLRGTEPGTTAWWPAMRAFWLRRARRLLPVTVLGLVASGVVTVLAGTPDMVRDLRGDLLSVVGYTSNWRFLLADRSYGALLDRPSAFQHYWSLSLEEQCFLVLPLLVAGVTAVVGRRWAPGVILGLATVAAAVPLVVPHNPDAAYYGTHVRSGEFLAGTALALVLARVGGGVPDRWRAAVASAGSVSLVGLGAVMLTIERDQAWLYRGGLGLFALPAVSVVAAATLADGPVTRLLSWRPLAALGRATFPVYVLHWPIFVLLDRSLPGLDGATLAGAKIAAGIAAGVVAHRWLERPLLTSGRAGPVAGRRIVAGSATALAVLAAGSIAWSPSSTADYDFAEAERQANRPIEAVHDPRPALALFGGSTAVSLGAAAFDWAVDQPSVRVVPGNAQLGCGVVTEGLRGPNPAAGRPDEVRRPDPYCTGWETRWPQAADAGDVRLAVVFGGVWETADWRLDGDDGWTDLTDPDFAELVRARLVEATDLLVAEGRRALLATTPPIGPGRSGRVREERGLGPTYPERVDVYNRLVRDVAAGNGQVDVLEYGAFIESLDQVTAVDWLPDGIHPTTAAARAIWDGFLGHEVVRALLPATANEMASAPPGQGEEHHG